ncbi:MAG: glutamyl-tRNA reductase [Mangrovibacterium sp.]
MIGIIGLSHKTAPIHIREKFSLNAENSRELAQKICKGQHIDALLILSTCNRTEFYYRAKASNRDMANMAIVKHLINYTGITDCQKSYFYGYEHRDAVNHLFRVVSSLDSMVLGEYQIVSQVKNAYQLAEENKTLDKELMRLFQKALETGKQVRTQTQMSTGAFSVSYAAVERCLNEFPKLSKKKILLVGTGETGELVIQSLFKKGGRDITVVNRTFQNAVELAGRYRAKVRNWEELNEVVSESDIIISAVTSQEPIINETKAAHYQLFIDLGVPRNMNEKLHNEAKVTLLNVDDLQHVVAENQEKKQELVLMAQGIIDAKVDEFLEWLSSRNLSPAIQQIMDVVSEMHQGELAIFSKNKTDEEVMLLEEYSKHFADKMINTMIRNLKDLSDNGRHTDSVRVIERIFSK